ncbi:MAG: DDE-type integrase/transposase/recombinase [Methylotenera sp.]|nr:DDE-type integrase/transposase/recombinase [Methylotenera sp.]
MKNLKKLLIATLLTLTTMLASGMATNLAIAAEFDHGTGLIVHTDRGVQYTSEEYLALLSKYHVTASMSGRGNCYDNAVMERFFLNLKMERVWQMHYANQFELIEIKKRKNVIQQDNGNDEVNVPIEVS